VRGVAQGRLAAWASRASHPAGLLDITRRAGAVCPQLRAALSRQATSLPSPPQRTSAGRQRRWHPHWI